MILQKVILERTPQPRYKIIGPIEKRFSPRVFSLELIPDEAINSIFEAARWTPSGRNTQPWKYFLAKKGTKGYEDLMTCVFERNDWCKSAPVIIISAYDPNEPPQGGVNKWATYDLGAANLALILQAQELGYYARQIGSFDVEKTGKIITQIKAPYKPFVLIALGRIGTEEDYQKAEPEYVEKDLITSGRRTDIFEVLS